MQAISADQQVHCKIAQFSHALSAALYKEKMLDDLLEISNVNLKVLNKKIGKGPLIGSSLLHIACFFKHVEALGHLLKRGADFTAKNKNEDTALHHAFFDMFPEKHGSEMTTSGILENALINLVLDAHVENGNYQNPRSADGLSHFHIACACNHLQAVQLYLDNGVSVSETVNLDLVTFPGYSPLHFAARFCGFASAELLLKRGATVHVKDAAGLTPLHVVIERNLKLIEMRSEKDSGNLEILNKYIHENEKIIRLFLENIEMLDVDYMGFCKLHAACTLSDASFYERFSRDVDINCAIRLDSPMWQGYTALHFAVLFNVDTVKLLLQNGANISVEDAQGVTPFDLCLEKYGVEVLYDFLSAVLAFQNIRFSDNETKLLDFIRAICWSSTCEVFFRTVPKDVVLPENSLLWPGYRLPHLSVLFSKHNVYDESTSTDTEFCPVILYFKACDNVMTQDARGRTPLHQAFRQKKKNIVELIFRNQFEIVEVVDSDGLSHLHIACERENGDVVRTLLSQGANVNIAYRGQKLSPEVNQGSTPLHIAVSKGNADIVSMLIHHGADIYATDADGMTPMQQFAHLPPHMEQTKLKVIGDLLLPLDNLKNSCCSGTGISHLHFASFTGNERAVVSLLKLGADANAVFSCSDDRCRQSPSCSSGYSPLHFAVRNNHTRIVVLLVQAGADILYKRPNGMALLYEVLRDTFDETDSNNTSTTRVLAAMLSCDAKLQKRVEEDSGLTLLHIACYLQDPDEIEISLADPRVAVNAQMRADSPIWPKATPLHVVFDQKYDDHKVTFEKPDRTIERMLDRGADTTMTNNEGDTPVHKAWSNWCNGQDFWSYGLVSLFLKRTNFSINPVNQEGISHFHLACIESEYAVVENFLKNDVEVNLSIDYLNGKMTFQTPLRFAIESLEDRKVRLQTIDVLLKYGADVNAEDERGLTPLLKTVHRRSSFGQLFFEKLYKAGADINCTNMNGESILEIFFSSEPCITNEELQFFFDHRNLFNTYNSVDGKGIVSMMVWKQMHTMPNQTFILDAVMKIPRLFFVDQTRRTPIHNMVANFKTTLSSEQYVHYIEKFIEMGYDIDDQDSGGETALHLAAYFSNEKAVFGLLIAGADINIIDNSNRTALAVVLEFHFQSREDAILLRDLNRLAKDRIERHIIALLICGLEVNPHDFELLHPKHSEEQFRLYCQGVLKELEYTKLVRIGTGSLTVKDFLSETGAIASRPAMISAADRDAVDEFFKSIDVEEFPHLKTLLKLQYKKLLIRLELMGEATNSLRDLAGSINGFSMPELCCRMIIRFLNNTEIKRLIASMSTSRTFLLNL